MASTPQGRRLTEQHRLAQQQVRAGFLAEFLVLWALLDSRRLDETSPGWVRAVLALIRDHRLRSMEVAAAYFFDFQAVEAPSTPGRRPVIEVPEIVVPQPAPGPGRQQAPQRRPQIDRRPGRATEPVRRPAPEVIPNPRSSRVLFDDPIFEPRPQRRTRIDIPDINWARADRAARVSVIVTGPVSQKQKATQGKPLERARDESLAESAGEAARHVLTGGRRSLLTLLDQDPQAVGWARVTDGDPCAFCAMLSGRGIVYKTQQSAGFEAHPNCACTAEPAYSRSAPLPGRGQEFRDLWNAEIKGNYSGKDAARAWRRLYEQRQRDARRGAVA